MFLYCPVVKSVTVLARGSKPVTDFGELMRESPGTQTFVKYSEVRDYIGRKTIEYSA